MSSPLVITPPQRGATDAALPRGTGLPAARNRPDVTLVRF